MIPVEDFTGPTISEIQKFIEITDEARKEGEVGNFPFFLLTCLIVDQPRRWRCTARRVAGEQE